MLSESTPDCSVFLACTIICLISPEKCMNTYIHFQIIEGNIAQHQANQPRSLGEPAETLSANDRPPIPYLSMPNQSEATWKIKECDSACLVLPMWRWGVWSKLAARTPRVATSSTTGSRRWPGPYPTGVSIQWRCRKGEWGCSTWYRDGCTEVKLLNPSQACTKQLLSTSLQITFPFFSKSPAKLGNRSSHQSDCVLIPGSS